MHYRNKHTGKKVWAGQPMKDQFGLGFVDVMEVDCDRDTNGPYIIHKDGRKEYFDCLSGTLRGYKIGTATGPKYVSGDEWVIVAGGLVGVTSDEDFRRNYAPAENES